MADKSIFELLEDATNVANRICGGTDCANCDGGGNGCMNYLIADYMIEHGATVQKTTHLFCTGNDEYYGPWGNCHNCGTDNICGSKFCRECGARIEVEI